MCIHKVVCTPFKNLSFTLFSIIIVLAIYYIILFSNSITPFCYGALATDNYCLMPCFPYYSTNSLEINLPP